MLIGLQGDNHRYRIGRKHLGDVRINTRTRLD
jgi:hypothetical protein